MAPERSEKYVISLDAVDISLLATNFKSKYDYAPLWTGNNRASDYYEFEIKNIDEDKDDEIPNIMCHICNIFVPKPYLKQHHDSFKHKINMKIAETALERLKNNMQNHSYCDNETNKSVHFCPTCVAVIKVKDKEKHDKSLAHKNSLMIDKYLHDFYVMYSDDNAITHDYINAKLNDFKKDPSCDIEFISARSDTDLDNDSSVITKDISVKSDGYSEKNDAKNYTSNNKENKQLNDSKEEFTNNVKKKKVKASIEKSSETIQFGTVVIDSETLEADKIIKDKRNESIVDNDMTDVSNDGFIIKTNKKRKGKSKVNKEINKTHPIEMKETQNKSEIVPTVVETKIPKNDSKVIKTTQIVKEANPNISVICKICVGKNKDHNICEFLAEELTNYSEIPKLWDIIKDFQYHLVMRTDIPFCMVCNLNCAFVNVVAHLFSDEHFDKYERVVEENFLLSEDDFTICQACNVKVKKELELLHCEDMAHITKQEMFKKKLKR